MAQIAERTHDIFNVGQGARVLGVHVRKLALKALAGLMDAGVGSLQCERVLAPLARQLDVVLAVVQAQAARRAVAHLCLHLQCTGI